MFIKLFKNWNKKDKSNQTCRVVFLKKKWIWFARIKNYENKKLAKWRFNKDPKGKQTVYKLKGYFIFVLVYTHLVISNPFLSYYSAI